METIIRFVYTRMSRGVCNFSQISVRTPILICATLLEFITGDWEALLQWNAWDDGQHIALNMSLVYPVPFAEYLNYAMDGTEFFGFKRVRFAGIWIHDKAF